MKEIIRSNYKILVGILIGFVISVSCVYAAATIIEGKEVAYDNSTSQGDGTNVQDAIDELYASVGFSKDVWKDKTLNGADPVITGELKPVVISSDGKTYYANEHTKWYDYSQKRWANAVILESGAKEYKPGEKIEDTDIESYFVWIPRYKYKVWDMGNYDKIIEADTFANVKDTATTAGKNPLHQLAGNPQIIDIQFGDTKAIARVEAKNVGEYQTHPAFKLGDTELNGIWVGKFETGGTSKSDMVVKPNETSWRNQNVKGFFEAGYDYKRSLESHMMKNTEWGAVAYLSHSAYGIGGKVNNNNNSDFKTGYSAAPGTDQNKYPGESGTTSEEAKTLPWDTPTGHLASTTGNITGVYDMVGGAWEYVASYVSGQVGQSGFDISDLTEKYKNYIDVYNASSTMTSYKYRILGDATGELGPFFNYIEDNGTTYYHSSWYADDAYFVYSEGPWFGRGGYWADGVLAGQFHFRMGTGGADNGRGFRLVLSPNSN